MRIHLGNVDMIHSLSKLVRHEMENVRRQDRNINGMRNHRFTDHGGNVGPKHVCHMFRHLGRDFRAFDGFCDVGCGFGNPNITYSSIYPKKLSVAIDRDPLRIQALRERMPLHNVSIVALELDFVAGWRSGELDILHDKQMLYFINNINFTAVNYSFLQFFRRYAAPDSVVICYEELYKEYSNSRGTRNEWFPHIEKQSNYLVEVSTSDHTWRATGKRQRVHVYRRTHAVYNES